MSLMGSTTEEMKRELKRQAAKNYKLNKWLAVFFFLFSVFLYAFLSVPAWGGNPLDVPLHGYLGPGLMVVAGFVYLYWSRHWKKVAEM